MTDANSRQPGGDHYRKRDYQHWDFICDTGAHYLLGCATKYVARWRDKNGKEDLEKAIHYLEKARERGIYPPRDRDTGLATHEFATQLQDNDAAIVTLIMRGSYETAIGRIKWLINPDDSQA